MGDFCAKQRMAFVSEKKKNEIGKGKGTRTRDPAELVLAVGIAYIFRFFASAGGAV